MTDKQITTADMAQAREGTISFAERVQLLNRYVDNLVLASDAMPFTWEEKAAALMLTMCRVLAKDAPLKGRRGQIINAAVADFRQKLQAHLPL